MRARASVATWCVEWTRASRVVRATAHRELAEWMRRIGEVCGGLGVVAYSRMGERVALTGRFPSIIRAGASGTLANHELKWKPDASVCVVMASGGYPGSYPKGKVITGLDAANKLPNTKVFHAGTALKDGQIVTNNGRVLGVTENRAPHAEHSDRASLRSTFE